MASRAVFFDRDGTLNVEVHFLHRVEDFAWTEDAVEAVRYCNASGYLAIVVSNQSGVARGYFPEEDVRALHRWMNEDLARRGAHLDAFYYCPHYEQGSVARYAQKCNCRKPATGMIDRACSEYGIDRRGSIMVGDKASDMECAKNAGLRGIRYDGGSLLRLVQQAIEQSK